MQKHPGAHTLFTVEFRTTTKHFVWRGTLWNHSSSLRSVNSHHKMSESEELSKNALKKKLKAEEAAKKKALKDAEKAAKVADVPKKEKLGGDDVELDPTQYYENRLRTVKNLGVSFLLLPLVLSHISLS
jgi:hypothetical protein